MMKKTRVANYESDAPLQNCVLHIPVNFIICASVFASPDTCIGLLHQVGRRVTPVNCIVYIKILETRLLAAAADGWPCTVKISS